MAGFAPTAEQIVARDLYLAGGSLVLAAGAGTGKTSTLLLLAEVAPDRRVQYVAFNKAIVVDAGKKMPRNVSCKTAHALAFRAVGYKWKSRLDNSARMKSWEIAKVLRLNDIRITAFTGVEKRLSASYLAGLVMRGIGRFCQTGDAAPSWRHVPNVKGLDAPWTPGAGRSFPVNDALARMLEPALHRAWADLLLEDGKGGVLKFDHDHYLKAWQLSNPKIASDVIMFDECQDANPVLLAIVEAQAHAQVVWVGDSQQAIYEFTGAVNAIEKIGETADHTAFLTQSFRFGPAIADVANAVLAKLDAPMRLSGLPSIVSSVGPVENPVCILTRTNAEAVRAVLNHLDGGGRPHLVGGAGEIRSFARAAARLMNYEAPEHPDLGCFSSWAEVQEYVQEDEQGGDLRLMVKLIDEFGVDRILAALDAGTSEDDATLIVSTAHKSKGREWDTVALGPDFPEDDPSDSELRLLYVAATRAKLRLDVTAAKYLTNLLAAPTLPAPALPAAAPLPAPAVLPVPVAALTDAPVELDPAYTVELGLYDAYGNLLGHVPSSTYDAFRAGARLHALTADDIARLLTWYSAYEGYADQGTADADAALELRLAAAFPVTDSPL